MPSPKPTLDIYDCSFISVYLHPYDTDGRGGTCTGLGVTRRERELGHQVSVIQLIVHQAMLHPSRAMHVPRYLLTK
jgi:hypothetical protein